MKSLFIAMLIGVALAALAVNRTAIVHWLGMHAPGAVATPETLPAATSTPTPEGTLSPSILTSDSPREHLTGKVFRVHSTGIFVVCSNGSNVPVSHMQSIGGGGGPGDAYLARFGTVDGLVFLTGHPDGVADGDPIDCIAIRDGTYTSPARNGGTATTRHFVYVQKAAPPAPKASGGLAHPHSSLDDRPH